MAKTYLLGVAQEFASKRSILDVQFVGKGGFKETFRLVDNSGNEFALKLIDPIHSSSIRLDRELKLLAMFDCPLISKLHEFGAFVDSASETYIFIIEEFLGGGTLEDKLQSGLSKQKTIELAISLMEALIYIKNRNIVHRDIKPANVLFREKSDIPVLIDFGIARDLNNISVTPTWQLRGPCSPYYASPEQLNNDKNLIDWRTDQFSLGIVLSICFTGLHPFQEPGFTIDQTIDKVVKRDKCSSTFIARMQTLGLDAIPRMLEPWPHRRYQDSKILLEIFQKLR